MIKIKEISVKEHNVKRINQISQKYPNLRNLSKAPTFALTYSGTYKTLMENCGFTADQALSIEKNYHDLYKVSDQWVSDKLSQAIKDGYILGAFGLKIRTPLLKQSISIKKLSSIAAAESRTAGNALGQSWCLLNTRAGIEFNSKLRKSKFATQILPCGSIHDAQYFLVQDNLEALMYINEHLVQAIKWNQHPDIYHPQVGLEGELSIFYPSWAKEIVIPNNASADTITSLTSKAYGE